MSSERPDDLSCLDAATPTEAAAGKAIAVRDARPAAVPMIDGCLRPDSPEGIFRLASGVAAAGMLPSGVHNVAAMAICLAFGFERGMTYGNIVKGVMVVNNRPALFGDAPLDLAMRSGLVEDIGETIAGEGEAMVATCRVKRVRVATPIVRTFSVDDAKTAGLWGKAGPWKAYPKRMLQLRARGFALRDAVPDALGGFAIAEEYDEFAIAGSAPRPTVQSDAAAKIEAMAR